MAMFDQSLAGGTMFQPQLNTKIDPGTGTVEGRVGNLLTSDSRGTYTNPVVRQATDRQEQAFNAHGLLNSSMAMQAGQEAAISKAVDIATPDAAAINANQRANVDTNNKFAGDELAHSYTLDTGAQQAANAQKLSAQQAAQTQAQATKQSQLDQQRQAALAEQQSQLDTQRQTTLNTQQNTADLTKQNAQQSFTVRQNYQQALANVDNNLQKQIDTINASQMTPQDKSVAIQQARAQRDGDIAFQNTLFSRMPGWQQEWLAQSVPTSGMDVAGVTNVDTLSTIANDPGQPQASRDAALQRLNALQGGGGAAGGGTIPQSQFDEAAYLRANPDVAAAVARGETTAYQHYIQFGQREGRQLGFAPQGISPVQQFGGMIQQVPGPENGGNVNSFNAA